MRIPLVWALVLTGLLGEPAAAQPTKGGGSPKAVNMPDTLNAGPCNNAKLARYTESANSTSETVEGPACVEVSPVNTLRNFVFITTTSTQTAGPSPASIFPSSGDKSAGGGPAPNTLDDLSGRVRRAQADLRERQDSNRVAAARLDDLIGRLREFIAHSDESVGGGHFDTLINQIKDRKAQIDQALQNSRLSWKAGDDIVAEVHSVQNNWVNLPVDHPEVFSDPATKTDRTNTYNALKTQLDDLETKALQQASGSDQAKAIGKNLGLLSYWSDVLGSFLEADGSVPHDPASKFVMHQDVPCRTLFNVNKQTAVKLTVGDRLPFFDGQPMSTQTRDAFVTVTCASPFSISGGVAFSFIEQREFAIVQSPTSPGATTTVNKFGFASRSTVHPLPLAMAHLRFYEWDKHRYALHATFGVAANIQGTNAGGSNAEYLPGLSFSLFRTMYLTVGIHIGKQASLAGGFNVGDTVPSGITSPPIQTSSKTGAGFAITFTKP
jgi:hypothetical protein